MYVPTGRPFQIESTRPASLVPGAAPLPFYRCARGLFANGGSSVFAAHIICRRNLFPKSSAVRTFAFSPRTLIPKTRENREGLFPLAEMNKRCCRQNGIGARLCQSLQGRSHCMEAALRPPILMSACLWDSDWFTAGLREGFGRCTPLCRRSSLSARVWKLFSDTRRMLFFLCPLLPRPRRNL